jgi:Alr-MurF fusion protein
MLLFSQLPKVTEGQLLQVVSDHPVVHLLYDSRKIVVSLSAVFFAIRSERRNGHDFIKELYEKGIRQFVISDPDFPVAQFSHASFYLAGSTVKALQDIAAYHRARFDLPVIAVTGSNGKTIIKEWLSQLLSDNYNLVKSPKSFNSQIGVPLSVWQINAQHELAIFEAGISRTGEMEALENIIKPDIGILTNIGSAHDEGFRSRHEKLLEKLKLFRRCNILIYNADQPDITEAIREVYPYLKTFTWGEKTGDVLIKDINSDARGCSFNVEFQKKSTGFRIPYSDPAMLQNVMQCIALMYCLRIPAEEICLKVSRLQPLGMRLELKEGINGSYLVDDAYNNDMAGLTIALQFLDQQKQRPKKSLILSDLYEAGIPSEDLYREISEMVRERNISRFIGVGTEISKFREFFGRDAIFFENTEDFLQCFNSDKLSGEVILIKGARRFRFERIVQILSEKVHGTVLEINLDALSHNLNYYRSFLKPDTRIMVMVKAFAYGSGSAEVANLLQFHKVDYLAVAYTDEGVALRNQGITVPVMVMNPSWQSFDKLFHYNLEPEIFSFRILNELLEYISANNVKARIHLKFDTGMHRLGFEEKDLDQLSRILINQQYNIIVQTVFTHLAAADDACFNDFSHNQLATFERMTAKLESLVNRKFVRHALNSAGIVRFPENQMEMVRLGIGLYGVEANSVEQDKLLPVGTLKTVISQIKILNEGETVGYSRKGKITGLQKVATIAIGYADGYDRRFSNGRGKVLVKGKLCPVIGNVCMDMCMIDITGVDAEEGDVVTVFGESPTIIDLAKEIGTIPYEILTNVSGRVKRVFYAE